MMLVLKFAGLAAPAALLLAAASPSAAQQVRLGTGSVVEAVQDLDPGEYVWTPQIAPNGPLLLIVNLSSQRALLYRNGVPIAATTVSTGRPGHSTPTGLFTILQKQVEHYSSTYDNAPMPYMQRLTWRGVALHAGNLPGYPASHGCIRLPAQFAKRLYGVTRLGMTVLIIDQAATPRLVTRPAGAQPFASSDEEQPALMSWHPDRSPEGPVSIVISAADRRAIVLRNGVEIGSAPVTVGGTVMGTWAYALTSGNPSGRRWTKVSLGGDVPDDAAVPAEEWQRFHTPENFRKAVASIVEPGTTIIVTADSLDQHSAGSPLTVIEAPNAE